MIALVLVGVLSFVGGLVAGAVLLWVVLMRAMDDGLDQLGG